jgi:hypothetical protein
MKHEDHAGRSFTKVVAALIGIAIVAVFGFALVAGITSTSTVRAQGAGVIGIQAINVPVFTAQATTKSSTIFQDIGAGINVLRYCTSGFTGTIDLEWARTSSGPFTPLASATYVVDTNCHPLTVNGYWPNLRSTVTVGAGSVTADYAANSGPTGFASPGISSTGPVSPAACDHNSFSAPIAPSLAAPLIPGVAGTTIYVCDMTVSFSAATTAGFIQLGSGTNAGGCPGFVATWAVDVLPATPQIFPVGSPLGAFLQIGSGQTLCVSTGANTANTVLSFSWAQLAQ